MSLTSQIRRWFNVFGAIEASTERVEEFPRAKKRINARNGEWGGGVLRWIAALVGRFFGPTGSLALFVWPSVETNSICASFATAFSAIDVNSIRGTLFVLLEYQFFPIHTYKDA